MLATLAGIAEKAVTELADGRTVRLGDLGSLFITLRTEGSEDVDGFTQTMIKGVNVRFRPSSFLRKQLIAAVTYEKSISKKAAAAAAKQSNESLQSTLDSSNGEGD